ncbi:DUF7385 family protein [Natrarchaeobius oligotrophus]|uniref:Flagella cluster protein n=1 Tax=Natrarchaeobius chitinivorans TaxID=1679083 RepID=A0A3N6PKH3_NATCH|nr:flagella cluster protein [Natrarchaeobius chitinivorans]RQG99245.1 flagella cluster protein [Natrarchaeobius chitinivorans]
MNVDFDVHEHRHRMKLLRDSGDVAVFDDRDGLTCPVCSRAFDRLVLIRAETFSVPQHAGAPFCLVRRDDDVALFRHEKTD